MSNFKRRAFLVPLLAGVLGCSDETPELKTMRVWGDVSYDGKPIKEGTIDFVSTDGSPPAEAQIENGHYDIPAKAGPVAEKAYKVEIKVLEKFGPAQKNMMPVGGPTMEPYRNIIPPEYNVKSTLKATISANAGENQFDFKLDRSPG